MKLINTYITLSIDIHHKILEWAEHDLWEGIVHIPNISNSRYVIAQTWTDNGFKYRLESRYHNNNGPAIILANGDKEWWDNGHLHRLDGPAVECNNNTNRWFINGIRYSELEYWLIVIK